MPEKFLMTPPIERSDNIIKNHLFRRQFSLKHPSPRKDLSDDIEESPLKTHIVIKFSEKSKQSTCEDVEKIIQEFGLQTSLEILSKTEKYLYISATNDVLLKLADEHGLTKKTVTGTMQKFNRFSVQTFLVGDMTEEDVVINSEAPVLIKDTIKPSLMSYFRNGTIEEFFPLHDIEYLDKFSLKIHRKLPIENIRNYFGSSIGLYFAFLESYTNALIVPTVFGILQYIFEFSLVTVCAFYMIWTTIFLELWKRRCSTFSYRWGTIDMTSLDKPRTSYYGELKPDPITGKLTPHYPMKYTYMQMYLVSYPVVFLCAIASMYFSIYQFQIEGEVLQDFGPDSKLLYVPVIVQSVLIAIFSWAYEKLATFLTEIENHRTRSQYDRHRVNKLIIFEIVNNFFTLFYIAFVLGDINQLKYQLMMQLIIFQLVCIAQEIGIPLMAVIRLKISKYMHTELDEDKKNNVKDISRYEQSFFEGGLDKYTSTYEDYLQICIQFGYVVLFAAVAPFAALGALINNICAIYIDMFKLCNIFKRPFARRTKNIGAWQSGFEVLSVIAVVSNCGLLYMQDDVREAVGKKFPTMPALTFVLFEHILLIIKFILHMAIHEKPRSIRLAQLIDDHETHQALKHLKSLTAIRKNK